MLSEHFMEFSLNSLLLDSSLTTNRLNKENETSESGLSKQLSSCHLVQETGTVATQAEALQ